MCFSIENEDLLEKNNTIWEKELFENKIKSHGDEVTDF